MIETRAGGVLLHISSLPSKYGIGDFGPSAYKFIDFLSSAQLRYWQILPLNPTDLSCDNSPYHSISAFALNPLFISPELLIKQKLLYKSDLLNIPKFSTTKVNYSQVSIYKRKLFSIAFGRSERLRKSLAYRKFIMDHKYWLQDYALFIALKNYYQGKIWNQWSDKLKNRDKAELQYFRKKLARQIELEKFLQYLCYQQWQSLKQYAHRKNIQIIGDLPIYLNYDSVDVWVNPEIFKLNHKKEMYVVAGVPPDYFSKTGQLWGNPLYNWNVLRKNQYQWWLKRIEHNLRLFDLLRIDHFRGLVGYWQVSAKAKTAIKGKWIKTPAQDFFYHLQKKFPELPFIAEDLGMITSDVKKIMQQFNLPGMKVLLFAFNEDNLYHPYLPHNYEPNCVAYTGTHDNNTIIGWYKNEAQTFEKKQLFNYLRQKVPLKDLNWKLIELLMASKANLVIVPMQDILGLGANARMNQPASNKNNWQWRMKPNAISDYLASKLSTIIKASQRINTLKKNANDKSAYYD
ncbi:MAG: 4-alpha-glucanotransferase [candidate division WOR-3 bacterium]|nr:4-alpha-glucanotransferase [candidate division WOR-3 bacterium]